jgi:hypothetical protein
MPYFNFTKVTNPPNDELVNVTTQINNNLDEIDTKVYPFNQKPSNFGAITKTVGTEAFNPNSGFEERISVWDGSAWRASLNHASPWSAWSALSIRSPAVIRTGFPVMYRTNNYRRQIQLSGGVLFDAAANAWPTGTTVEITSDGALSASFAPDNTAQMAVQQGTAGPITTVNGFASAVVLIEKKTTPDRTSVSIRYQGDAGGGNYVMLDGISWYYV